MVLFSGLLELLKFGKETQQKPSVITEARFYRLDNLPVLRPTGSNQTAK